MLFRKYLFLLICPHCHSSLSESADNLKCTDRKCRKTYPIVNGIPVLLNENESIFSISHFVERKDTFFEIHENKIRKFLKQFIPSLSLNFKSKANYKILSEMLLRINSTPLVLIIGGSIEGDGIKVLKDRITNNIIETDVSFGPYTQIICDAHNIPFQDRSFDCVIVQAVMEHVVDPLRCADEIHRVLKEKGFVYAETPFMQQVHGREYDFTRFTPLGHRRLFRRFEEVNSGPLLGTATSLLWAFKYFLLSVSDNQIIRRILGTLFNFTCFWFKYFDLLFINNEGTLDGASGLFFVGQKNNTILDDKSLVKQYRGGFKKS